MVEQTPWVERKFVFINLHEGLFPDIVERLRGTPARLEESLKNLSKEILTAKPGGGWSIKEEADIFMTWRNYGKYASMGYCLIPPRLSLPICPIKKHTKPATMKEVLRRF